MDKKMIKNVLLVYLIAILIIGTGLLFGISKVPMRDFPGRWEELNTPFGSLLRWDTGYYKDISLYGYFYDPKVKSNVTFFPLYPLIARLFSNITGLNVNFSGIILSNIFFLLSLFFLYKLVLFDKSHEISFLTVLYMSIFPAAFFFVTMYAESLFLLLTVLFFYFMRKKQFILVFIFGFLAGLTRVNAVLLSIPMVYIAIKDKQYIVLKNKQFNNKYWLKSLLAIAGPFIGLCLYMVYLKIKFNNPLIVFSAHSNFIRYFGFFLKNIFLNLKFSINTIVHKSFLPEAFDVWFLILFIVLVVYSFKNMRREYLYYVIPSLFLFSSACVDTTSVKSLLLASTRFLVVLFPVFIVLGEVGAKNKILNIILIIIFSNFLLLYTSLFCRWYWVG